MLFKIFKPFVFMNSPNLVSSKCLFGELENYLYNDYMITQKRFTTSKTKKGLDN
jgi:hypothetical protein